MLSISVVTVVSADVTGTDVVDFIVNVVSVVLVVEVNTEVVVIKVDTVVAEVVV